MTPMLKAASVRSSGVERALSGGFGEAISILFADEDLLIVNKPAGLLAVPGRGPEKADCLSARMQAIHPDAQIVHRLDMATSGLVLMALGKSMQGALSRLFRERQVCKRYVAVVDGSMPATGEIELPLIADWPNRPRQKVDFQRGKPSLTRFRLLSRDPDKLTSRIELEPVTGRTHQLRIHLQAIGHPIVGDRLYSTADSGRLLLHASYIGFAHPASGKWVEFELDAEF